MNYSELSQELAAVMASLEQGDLGVDDAVKAYARGLEIVRILEQQLKQAENQVSELRASTTDGDTDEEE